MVATFFVAGSMMPGSDYSTVTCSSLGFVTATRSLILDPDAVHSPSWRRIKSSRSNNSPAVVDHYKSEGLDIRLGSADNLPFPDSSVDAIYSCWLLEHLNDPVVALTEARRVLRPNGYGLFIVPSVRSLTRGFYNDYTHIRPYSPQSLAQVARAAGLTNFSAKYLFWTKGLRRLVPLVGDHRMMGVLSLSDSVGRNFRCLNRDNLMFELWT